MYQTKPPMSTCEGGFGPGKPRKSRNLRVRSRFPQITSPSRVFLAFSCDSANQTREARYEYEEICRRGDRHVLAHFRRMRQRGDRGRLSAGRHWTGRRVAGIRAERRDDGLCHRPYLRLPSQSGGNRRPRRGRAFSGRPDRALRDRAGDRRHSRRGAAVRDRERRARLRRQQGLCVERLWRAFARPVQHGGRASSRKW